MSQKLTQKEKKILRKFLNKKVKPIERKMSVVHPFTKKQLTFATINLNLEEQIIANKLFNKGYLTQGKTPYFHKLILTEKGKKEIAQNQNSLNLYL